MKKLFTFLTILAMTYGVSQAQVHDTIVKWTFPDSAIAVAPFANAGLAVNRVIPISSKGGTNAITYKTAGATSYCASTANWTAGNATKYWLIKVVTTNYSSLQLSSKQRSSNTGPKDFKLQYMIGYAGTWTDVPGGTVLDSNSWTKGVLSNLSLPTACDNKDTVYLRWIMTTNTAVNGSAVANAGTSRIDDLFITGVFTSSLPATKLSVVSVNGGTDPYVNTGFYAVVKSLDASSNAASVTADVNYTITLATGTGALGGTLTGTILSGTNTDTIFGITYNTVETGVSITATDNAATLTAGTSGLFNVVALPPAAVKLELTNVNGGVNPYVGYNFTATVEARDISNNPVNVVTPVNITLSSLYGTGILSGTTTGVIASGTSSVTISGITYNVAENNIALKVVDNAATLIADTSALFNVLPIPAAPALVITEIMYNPPESNTDSLEFVEFYNNSSTSVPIKNFTFNVAGSGTYTFKNDTIAANAYYLITVDSLKFTHFYNKIGHKWNFGGLGNSGKLLVLRDNFGTFIDSVHYLPSAPWPTAANGNGSSLTLCDPNSDNALAINWQASAEAVSPDSVNHKIVRATPGTGCITTGIYNYNVSNYSVNCFPNPVRESMTLSLEGQASEIEIFDVLGNIVYSIVSPTSVTNISTEKMSKGIYIIKVLFDDNSVITKKISVM